MSVKKAVKPVSRMGAPAASVDAYLAALPDEKRVTLERLRKAVRAAAPNAAEMIGYGMPYYKYKGRPLFAFAAFKAHCSIFPMSGDLLSKIPELKRYEMSKGTMHFPIGKPPPATLVRRIIKARMDLIEGK